VDLPLNASEDRVVGSLDLEAALREGSKRFEMGVLGKANGNLLYIDEVNLLDDHVVDVLLDVAVSGRNVVMREGVTYSHPSRFLLVGTMNPEEGELRPQLLDRFGLCVEISGEKEISLRKQIVDRVLSFEREEPEFLASPSGTNGTRPCGSVSCRPGACFLPCRCPTTFCMRWWRWSRS